jgi:predicted ATPase/class 3 adenylate cyclase
MVKTDLLTGTVTFAFTDIEGSTRILGQLGDRYTAVLEEHQRLLRETFGSHGGVEVSTEGDSFFYVFPAVRGALAAAIEGQRALARHDWPEGARVNVRMGFHTGEAILGGDSYVGMDVHRTARIAAAGHGGQILVSGSTAALLDQRMLEGVMLLDLGSHRLKDLPQQERLFQVTAEGLRKAFPPVRSLDARLGNLPTPRTTFVGRGRELEELGRILETTRLLTMTGPGGTGKTRLAIQLATEVQERFSDGAFFVGLAPVTDPARVGQAIGERLGLREDAERPAIESVSDHLRDREVLLLLDNFEQVIDAATLVGNLLDAAPRVRVLVTSREALRIQGELEYAVPPLPVPDIELHEPLEELLRNEAVRLFTDRASAVRPGFGVSDETAPAVARICAELDGLPLAIELAAARVKILSPQQIVSRLGERLTLLGDGMRDLPDRQRTLRGAIAWSYDLLSDPERQLFDRLAVFAGGCTLEGADEVCNPAGELGIDTLEGVASLVNKSLLRQTETPGGDVRFLMLVTIREFARERLAASDGEASTQRRFVEHFLGLAERAAPELTGEQQATWLDRLAQEHDNLRAAIESAAHRGWTEAALRLGAALWRFWQIRGHLREAADQLDRLIALPGAERDQEALAMALEASGSVHYWMAHWEVARDRYETCLELRRAMGDPAAVAHALYNLSFVFLYSTEPMRDPEQAARLLEEAFSLFNAADDAEGAAGVRWSLAWIYFRLDRLEDAQQASEEALRGYRAAGNLFGACWVRNSYAAILWRMGDRDRALAQAGEALRHFAEAGDLTGVALALTGFSGFALESGDEARALRLAGASDAVAELSGTGIAYTLPRDMGWVDPLEELKQGVELSGAWSEGLAMTVERAVAYALEGVDPSVPTD